MISVDKDTHRNYTTFSHSRFIGC